MFVVEVFLPLCDDDGWGIGNAKVIEVRRQLFDKFGGLTVKPRSPSQGYIREGKSPAKDDLVVLEVTVPELDRAWWDAFKADLEQQFRQREIQIRASELARL